MGLQLKPFNSFADEFGGISLANGSNAPAVQQAANYSVSGTQRPNAGVTPAADSQAYGGPAPAYGTPAPNSYEASLELPAPYAPGQYGPGSQQSYEQWSNNSGFGPVVNGLIHGFGDPLISTAKTAVLLPWLAKDAITGQSASNALNQTYGTTNRNQILQKIWGGVGGTIADIAAPELGGSATLGAKIGVGSAIGGLGGGSNAALNGGNANDILGATAQGSMFGAGAGLVGGVAENLLNRGAPPAAAPVEPAAPQGIQVSPQDQLAMVRGQKPTPAGFTVNPDAVKQAFAQEQVAAANAPKPTVTMRTETPAPPVAPVQEAPPAVAPVNTGQQLTAPVNPELERLKYNSPPGAIQDINQPLYRGTNDHNSTTASPDRPVFHAETPEYAETYGNVSSHQATGKVFVAGSSNAYDRLSSALRRVIGGYGDEGKWTHYTGREQMAIQGYLNNTLEGERLSGQFNQPMPEVVKQAFNDLGVDYIKIPGDQFKGTVGNVGHQTEVIQIPKPTKSPEPVTESPTAKPQVSQKSTAAPATEAPVNPYSVNGTGRPLTDDMNLLKIKLNNPKVNPVRRAELQAEYNAKTEAATGVAGEAGPYGTGNKPNVAVREGATKVTVLRKVGGSANEIADRMIGTDNMKGDLRGTYRRAVPSVIHNDLSKEEFNNLGHVVEHGATPMNARVAQAAAQHRAAFPGIIQDYANIGGGKVGNVENYFPRDYSALKKSSPEYKNIIANMVKAGKAKTPGEAVAILNQLKHQGETSPHFFGSFDRSRISDTEKYTYTKSAYEKYLNGAAQKTAEAYHFGPKGQIGNELVARVAAEGGDHITARTALENYLHDAGAGRGKPQSAVRGVFGAVRLGKAVVSHAGQTSNVALVTRAEDLAKGLATRFTDENKQFVQDSDVNNPENLHALVDQASSIHGAMSKVTAPGLKQMMQFNRGVSAIAGREYGNFLAERGTPKDIAELRSLTVTGDIGKTLTYDQQLQVARGVTNKTMFTPSRADTPLHAETPTGKTIGQYRLAYAYKQTGLVYKQVIKEAGKGNLRPLLKFLAISAPVAAGTVATKYALSGKKEDPGQIAIDSAAALGGIPGELAAQAGEYLASNPWQTIAGAVAPAAGEAVKIAQAGQAAAGGNWKPAERYVAGLAGPAGPWLSKMVAPVNEEGVKFYKDANALVSKYGGDSTKEGHQLQSFFTSDVDPNTGAKMQSSPADQFERNQALVTNDQMRHDYQKLMQSQSSHDPMWDLPDDKLKTYLGYEAHYATDPMKQAIFNTQTDANGKNWMSDLAQQRSDFYNNLKPSGSGPPPEKNPQTPQYPTFTPDVTQLLNKYDAADEATKSAMIKDPTVGPQLSSAWAQKAAYSNALAKAQNPSNIDLKPYPVADAATQAIMNTYNNLPQHDGPKGGNATRAAWIQANPGAYAKMQDYLTQVSMHNLDKAAAQDQYVGTTPDSKFLGDIKNIGSYDITTTKAADGTNQYALITNQNGGSTNSTGTGGSKGYSTSYSGKSGSGGSSGSSSGGGKKSSIRAFGYAGGTQKVQYGVPHTAYRAPKVKAVRSAAGVRKIKTAFPSVSSNPNAKPKVSLKNLGA